MGGGGVVGGRPPNGNAYFVALAGILFLMLMLCCYFIYFCIKKTKQLMRSDSWMQTPGTRPPAPPPRPAYPVQPVVRDGAQALARMCKQIPPAPAPLPPPTVVKGDHQVHPSEFSSQEQPAPGYPSPPAPNPAALHKPPALMVTAATDPALAR